MSMRILGAAVFVSACVACSSSPDYAGASRQVGLWERTRVCDEAGLDDSVRALSAALWDVAWTCENPDATVVAVPGATKCSYWGDDRGVWIGCSPEYWAGSDIADIALAHEIGHLEGYGHPCSMGGADVARGVGAHPADCVEEELLCDVMAPSNQYMDVACVRASAFASPLITWHG